MGSYTEDEKKSQGLSGRLILELKDDQLSFCPITNSDEQTKRLLRAIADRLVWGDLAELAR